MSQSGGRGADGTSVASTHLLAKELARLPAQPVAAVRVLQMVEDPRASAADLARLIEADPALSARVIRLANAPYYGLARRVSSASRAVVLLGFSTVRALAVGAACGLLDDAVRAGSGRTWVHSLTTAASCSVVARAIGYPPSDAFSVGLLHDVGRTLLERTEPARYQAVTLRMAVDGVDLLEAEEDEFGHDHAWVGADVLESWRFPPAFVRAVASHHRPPEVVADTLSRIAIVGHALATECEDRPNDEPHRPLAECLEALGFPPARAARFKLEVQRELASLASFLRVG
jgi:putative nucleotidyltransferase with HDIG domain